MRIGIVGVGGMGAFHARTLAALAGVRVTAISDPSADNTATVGPEVGAEIVADPLALIADTELDGIVIASPDATHAEFAVAAIDTGCHVLCEKPLATTVEDAADVLRAEVACGRRLVQLGFMREFDEAHMQLVTELAPLGPIDHVHAVHRNANAVPRPLDEIVGQSLVHDIHTVRFVTGAEIVSVVASGSGARNDRNDSTTYRHVLATCELSNGAHALLEFDDCGFGYDVGVEVLTADGDVLTGQPTRAVRRRAGAIDEHVGTDWFGRFADAYRRQDQAWVDAIRAGEAPPGPTTWDGLAAQYVVDAIMESLATGRRVELTLPDRPALYG